MTADLIENRVPSNLPERLELIISDMSGVPRGKVMDSASFDPTHLPHLPAGLFFQSLTGKYVDAIATYNPTDSDVLLSPDWSTLTPVVWKDGDSAQVICETLDKAGKPLAYDPRNVLLRVLDAWGEDGLSPVIAPEAEFYLLSAGTPPEEPFQIAAGRDNRLEQGGEAFSIDALEKFDTFTDAVTGACQQVGIGLSGVVHEMGPAQVELNLNHGPALKLTDELLTLKRIVKGAAFAEGMTASFLAKPLDNRAGSGLHVHVSAYRDGHNVFSLIDGKVGEPLRYFIGGLQKFLPEAFALIAPNVNSYKRFVPGLAAPINLEWGYDNRTTGFRVPYDKDENGRLENRVIGADANPYLAVAATLGCGLLGMRNRVEPSPAFGSDAFQLATDLPRDLPAALKRLNATPELETLFGKPFLDVYTSVKTQEMRHFSNEVTPWERRFLGAEL